MLFRRTLLWGTSMAEIVKLIPTPDLDQAFEDFWKAFPRRVHKPLAKIKFVAICTTGLKTRTLDRDSGSYVEIELRATPEELIDGAKRYYQRNVKTGTGQYGFKEEGRYLVHPATWLNQGRWMDD